MRKSRKIWYGIGAFILTSGAAAGAPEEMSIEPGIKRQQVNPPVDALSDLGTRFRNVWAQGGEGGEGEGGEGGINLETVADDPVEYAIALQVIAAHYDAGLAAYAGGEREAGAQMFAHGHSEIYSVMEELFKKIGVTELGPSLEAAVAAAVDKKPLKQVTQKVDAVRKALQDAKRRGPQAAAPARADVYVVGELIERAAAQYSVALKDPTLEPYLDGLGFAIAARREAKSVTAMLRTDKKAEAAVQAALKLVQQAYPGAKRPSKGAVSESQLLVAATRARLAVSSYR
jgi:hypothetical protein